MMHLKEEEEGKGSCIYIWLLLEGGGRSFLRTKVHQGLEPFSPLLIELFQSLVVFYTPIRRVLYNRLFSLIMSDSPLGCFPFIIQSQQTQVCIVQQLVFIINPSLGLVYRWMCDQVPFFFISFLGFLKKYIVEIKK